MVPNVTQGSSFHRAGEYFLRDKGADSAERVEWTETLNLRTDNPDAALAVMAWTVRHADELKRAAGYPATGRKLEEPVYQFSLAWHPEQRPDRAEMMEAARDALRYLRMHDRQAVIVCHNDEPQPHIHVIVNRVHPDTGRAAGIRRDYLDLSRWAEKWEREHGKIYCEERVRNNERRRDREFIKKHDPAINRAWQVSDNGRSFAAALIAEGYLLARGDKQAFVIVDPHGKAHNPARQIERARARDIRAKLADLDPTQLPSAAQARARHEEEKRRRAPKIWDREAAEIERQKRELEAADAAANERDRADKKTVGKEGTGTREPQEPREPARKAERERGRFEGWANRRRAELQSRQLDDKGDLARRHYRQRENLNDELAGTYGPGIAVANRILADVQAREKAGPVLRLLYRLRGQAQRDRALAEAARANLADIENRMSEQRGKLERGQEAERTAQEVTQRTQDRALEERIATAYERREREGWQPLPDREPANDREMPEQEKAPETEWQRIQRLRGELHERERQQGRNGRDFDRER